PAGACRAREPRLQGGDGRRARRDGGLHAVHRARLAALGGRRHFPLSGPDGDLIAGGVRDVADPRRPDRFRALGGDPELLRQFRGRDRPCTHGAPGRAEPALHGRVRGGRDGQRPGAGWLGVDDPAPRPPPLGAGPAGARGTFCRMSGGGALEPVGSVDLALAHARRLLEKSPPLAAEQAGEILRTLPGEPRARLVLGAAHRLTGQVQAALEVLEPLAPEQPRAAAALVANDLPVAQARLAAHLQRFPTDIAALRMQAEVAARLQHIVDALRLLERCLELAPGFDAARNNYASLLNRSGRAEAALKQTEQLLAK